MKTLWGPQSLTKLGGRNEQGGSTYTAPLTPIKANEVARIHSVGWDVDVVLKSEYHYSHSLTRTTKCVIRSWFLFVSFQSLNQK